MNLTVNIKNAPSEVNRPYIVARFCNGDFWYYGQYEKPEVADEIALSLGMATVFDNSSYNTAPDLDKVRAEIAEFEERIAELPNMADAYATVRHCLEIIDKYRKE